MPIYKEKQTHQHKKPQSDLVYADWIQVPVKVGLEGRNPGAGPEKREKERGKIQIEKEEEKP